MVRVGSGLIFDGDDTLWETQVLYDQAKDEFSRVLAALGFPPKAARAALEDIDHERVATHGFQRSRFPGSMVAAYETLCRRHGVRPTAQTAEEVERLGRLPFERRARLKEGASQVLGELGNRYQMILLTKGDELLQQKRIDESGLRTLFDGIRIVSDKHERVWRGVVHDHGLSVESSYSIGNSVVSDILPALAVGLRCVLVRAPTWRFEDAHPSLPEGVVAVDLLPELLEVL